MTIWRRLNLEGRAGLVLLLALVLMALLAPWIVPGDPLAIVGEPLLRPFASQAHWLGTDRLGRDVLSELLYGTRTTLLVAFFSAAASLVIGSLVGTLAGFLGGIALPILTLSVAGIFLISMFLHRERLRVDRVKTLEVDAHTDPLTNLANRRLFDRVARRTFRKAASTGGDVFSLVMIDIDSFKSINDRWGHSNGDLVLVEISTIIRSLVRKSDLVARYGGEEIAILMPSAAAGEAMAMAEAIRRRVNETFFDLGRTRAHVTVSAGVATFTAQHQSMTELIEEADVALYRAKRLGRNRIELAAMAA